MKVGYGQRAILRVVNKLCALRFLSALECNN